MPEAARCHRAYSFNVFRDINCYDETSEELSDGAVVASVVAPSYSENELGDTQTSQEVCPIVAETARAMNVAGQLMERLGLAGK